MALAPRTEIFEEEFPANLDLNSPSVGILAQRHPGPDKCQVLDLGAPTESTVAFFAEHPCKVYLEDFHRSFIAPRASRPPDEDEDVNAAIRDALSFADTARFDLVLAWDLLCYMEPGTIEALMACIARSCHAGTLLFVTLPTRSMIPGTPARISISHRGRLQYGRVSNGQSISNPRFSPVALENMMPGFRLLHSFLLGDEMQEFLFSFA